MILEIGRTSNEQTHTHTHTHTHTYIGFLFLRLFLTQKSFQYPFLFFCLYLFTSFWDKLGKAFCICLIDCYTRPVWPLRDFFLCTHWQMFLTGFCHCNSYWREWPLPIQDACVWRRSQKFLASSNRLHLSSVARNFSLLGEFCGCQKLVIPI